MGWTRLTNDLSQPQKAAKNMQSLNKFKNNGAKSWQVNTPPPPPPPAAPSMALEHREDTSPPAGQRVMQARRTHRRAESIHLVSKCPGSKSDWVSWDLQGNIQFSAVGLRGFTLSGAMFGWVLRVREHPHEYRHQGSLPRHSCSHTVNVIHLICRQFSRCGCWVCVSDFYARWNRR